MYVPNARAPTGYQDDIHARCSSATLCLDDENSVGTALSHYSPTCRRSTPSRQAKVRSAGRQSLRVDTLVQQIEIRMWDQVAARGRGFVGLCAPQSKCDAMLRSIPEWSVAASHKRRPVSATQLLVVMCCRRRSHHSSSSSSIRSGMYEAECPGAAL